MDIRDLLSINKDMKLKQKFSIYIYVKRYYLFLYHFHGYENIKSRRVPSCEARLCTDVLNLDTYLH
jgi:hypothetical protein